MQNQELKKALRSAFDATKPSNQQAFLRQFPAPRISCGKFMLMQLYYLRFTVLLLSAAAAAALLLCCRIANREALYLASGLAPFLALSVLTARYRSFAYGMQDLEFAARFSLRMLLLARMGILAVVHLVLLFAAALAVGGREADLLQTGLALLLPYCTTVCIALPLTRRFRGMETTALSAAVAAVVGIGVWRLRLALTALPGVFALLLLAAELIVISTESVRFIQKMEELTWSYD